MHFTRVLAALVVFATSAMAQGGPIMPATTRVFFNNIYDQGADSLNIVACSNGPNGLETKGFTTLGSLPSFPRIGGANVVAGWNSPNCGTCWALTFNGNTINVLAIDTFEPGFDISQEAMDELTNGHAVDLGSVTATVQQVPASQCGL